MPYGTEPFTDGYGDYKQPTIIDYEKNLQDIKSISKFPKEDEVKILDQYNADQEAAFKKISEINPVYGGLKYQFLTTVVNNKITWDLKKITELKSNVDWFYDFCRYLEKRKKNNITT